MLRFLSITFVFSLAGCQTMNANPYTAQIEQAVSESNLNGLLDIKVSSDWEIVTGDRIHMLMRNSMRDKGYYVSKNEELDCYTFIDRQPTRANHNSWFTCQGWFHMKASGNPQIIGDKLAEWATAEKDPMIVRADKSFGGYHITSALGTFAQIYGTWYNFIKLPDEERKIVDEYIVRKLNSQKFPALFGNTRPCNLNEPEHNARPRFQLNTCSHVRYKVAVGQIILGLRLQDQTLLDNGHRNLYVVYAANIDKNGVSVPDASRGANAFNYYMEYLTYTELLQAVYKPLGYDFFEHTLPHGAKVHEYIATGYAYLNDFKLFEQYAKNNLGAVENPWSRIKNLSQSEFEKTDYAINVYNYSAGIDQWIFTHEEYVKRYQPSIYKRASWNNSNILYTANFGISAWQLRPTEH